MSARTTRAWASALFRAWLRACTVPDAHAFSPLAPGPEAALSAARVDGLPVRRDDTPVRPAMARPDRAAAVPAFGSGAVDVIVEPG
ncbi:hypothetical protein AB0C96_36140 [Streptomyces sp. NPDC048506]|uniref:hypothetical protein n=1 Tax=Streptomyces sp. NPDC048506 TaxID=3155028 RepID=UPI0034402627